MTCSPCLGGHHTRCSGLDECSCSWCGDRRAHHLRPAPTLPAKKPRRKCTIIAPDFVGGSLAVINAVLAAAAASPTRVTPVERPVETPLGQLLKFKPVGVGPPCVRVAQIMRANGAPMKEIADSLHVNVRYVERALDGEFGTGVA